MCNGPGVGGNRVKCKDGQGNVPGARMVDSRGVSSLTMKEQVGHGRDSTQR